VCVKCKVIKGWIFLMATNNALKKPIPRKIPIIIFSCVVAAIGLFFGIATLKQYNDFKPYKALAAELNETLGGGYKATYTWHCGIESTNCPSVRMIKDINFKDNDEAKTLIETYRTDLMNAGFGEVKRGICKADEYFKVYCSLDAKKNKLDVSINAKQDFIGVDINP
jgi:hypothetical protein